MSDSWFSRWRNPLGSATPGASSIEALPTQSYRVLCEAVEGLARTFARRAFTELHAQVTQLSQDFGVAAVVELLAREDLASPSIAFARCLAELLPDEVAVSYLERLVADPAMRSDAQLRLAKLCLQRGDRVRGHELLQCIIADDIHHGEARRLLATAQTFDAPAAGATVFGVANNNIALTERYELEHELGRGSEGVVYLASDLRLDRKVAIKIFHARARSPRLDPRLSQLPRVPVFIRVFAIDPRDRFFVTEYCSGGTLADVLASEVVAASEALAITIKLGEALAILFSAQLVHGDVKPTNILFRTARRTSEDLVLSDFGRMRKPDDIDAPLGTLAYMSPAALRSEPSLSQDLFALGIIFLQLLGVPDLPSLRRQILVQSEPAPTLFAAIPAARLAAFMGHERTLRAIVEAMLSATNQASPPSIVAALIALKKDIE